jgi:hypothetical protein
MLAVERSNGCCEEMPVKDAAPKFSDGTKADFCVIGGLVLCVLYVVAVTIMVMAAGRPFGYPLDDTYIHMALARTLATSGVWGVGATMPAAASSSPLWTAMLAGAYLLHPGAAFFYVSLILNVIAGCGLIVLLLAMFRRQPASVAMTAAIVCAASLPGLSVVGMEHVLHALLATALCFLACRSIAKPSAETSAADLAWIALLAGLSVTARYESLFLVAPLMALSAARLRLSIALMLGIGAAAPVLGFGLLWIHNGGWLLPNSLILKTHFVEDSEQIAQIRHALRAMMGSLQKTAFAGGFGAILLELGGLLGWHLFRRRQPWDMPVLFAGAALVATGGHFAFAGVGWLYRYEAWLIVLDAAAICLLAESLFGQKQLLAVAASLVLIFSYRTGMATHMTIEAIDDRRREHLVPAHFVADNYVGKTIVVGDIGAMAWLAPQTRALDLFGIGNNDPVHLRLTPTGYGAAALRDWALQNNARIAVVPACWDEVRDRLPPEWTLVATWHVPRNVVFDDLLVAFFAIAPDETNNLREKLKQLPVPSGVVVKFDPPRTALLECR